MQKIRLKKGEERRLRAGHLWVFSNEIDTKVTPLGDYDAGQDVQIESSRGEFLGNGYINPHSLITARLYSRGKDELLDSALLEERLTIALKMRESFYSEPFYRLVHGEGDFLPGLVVDRYNDVVVVQLNTAGMDVRRDSIVDAVQRLISPSAILLRNDSSIRILENLPQETRVASGELPARIHLQENGLEFVTTLDDGQKTGWFYDHRENRRWLQSMASGKTVLDVFSYLGGWAMNAAAGGASEVTAIDASQPAMDLATENARLNGFGDRFSTISGDAVELMSALQDKRKRFDIIVLDPPAFIKRKKDHRAGLRQYELINRLAIGLLNKNGILISASCSQHLSFRELNTSMLRGARKNRCDLQVLMKGGQGPDHPINAAIPETDYLKAICARMI